MKNIYICNTFSDYISQINIESFKEKKRIKLNSHSRVGPHGICRFCKYLITANNYSNDISIIDIENDYVSSYYIGKNCNDIKVCNERAYVACGDSNDIKIFNLVEKNLEKSIPCGVYPHSIDIDFNFNRILVCNMGDGTLDLINLKDELDRKKIKIGSYPTKAIFSTKGNFILVCESNLGNDVEGTLKIIDKDFNKIISLNVGKGPIDMYCNEEKVYISNFCDGTISVVDLNKLNIERKIKVGGMPRGIIEKNGDLYVGDYFNSVLLKICIETEERNCIYIGKEPNSMILV